MPDGSDVTNCGRVQVPEPEVTGDAVAVPDGAPDGEAEVPDGAGWLPGTVACGALGVRRADAEFGMTAIWGAAAISGSRAADTLFGPSRPSVRPLEVPTAAGWVPPSAPFVTRLTTVSVPASAAHTAAKPMTRLRERGTWRMPPPGNVAVWAQRSYTLRGRRMPGI